MPGPVPKSSDQRRRRNKPAGGEVDRRPGVPAEKPPAADAWHPRAQAWYDSLGRSGQREEYQASDWEAAAIAASILTLAFETGTGTLFAEWAKLNTVLLGTVGDRRRHRMELTAEAPAEPKARASSRDRLKVV